MEKPKAVLLLVKYNEANKKTIEKAVDSFCTLLNSEESTVEKIYQGDNQKIISAIENILDLEKRC